MTEPRTSMDGVSIPDEVLLDQRDYIVENFDVNSNQADDLYKTVKAEVMMVEQSVEDADWNDSEINAITNTLLAVSHHTNSHEMESRIKRLNQLVFLIVLFAFGILSALLATSDMFSSIWIISFVGIALLITICLRRI